MLHPTLTNTMSAQRLALSLVFAAALVAGLVAPPARAEGQLLRVGPGRTLTRPSQAAAVAQDGATVEIDAADYAGDVAVWRQNRLTLRGIGGRARLRAEGRAAEGKAIWVITGTDVTVENVELSGTRVRGHNGAGIRAEGTGLTVRNCRLHHNEMGILTNNNPASRVLIEDSELDHNRTDTAHNGRLGHNIYIGRIAGFVLRRSYVHDAHIGHLVKSRAKDNRLYDNRLLDPQGDSSFLIDLSEGGRAVIRDNELHQGARSQNRTAIAFAAEANREAAGQSLQVIDNDFTSDGPSGTFVRNFSVAPAQLTGNRLQGNVRPLVGKGDVR
jgi:hypothetical protein